MMKKLDATMKKRDEGCKLYEKERGLIAEGRKGGVGLFHPIKEDKAFKEIP
jgi:hypothetical protein